MSSAHVVGHQGVHMSLVKQEAEWVSLRCLAHTLRLEGDYVRAQAVERDLVGAPSVTVLSCFAVVLRK